MDELGGRLIKYNLKELVFKKSFDEKRSITLQEVAKETGIGISTVSRIANSKGDYHTTTLQLEKLCQYFRCTPNDLMTILPDPVKEDTHEGDEKVINP
jgi:putative transcriptional regulator